ncbi:hypothetical protein BMS3Bbin02_00817 [bacterium BMS3Bbin02]|nr:hypothetical protein BMS3Bbin02_00817 [bacterium BMS3Bbin02]
MVVEVVVEAAVVVRGAVIVLAEVVDVAEDDGVGSRASSAGEHALTAVAKTISIITQLGRIRCMHPPMVRSLCATLAVLLVSKRIRHGSERHLPLEIINLVRLQAVFDTAGFIRIQRLADRCRFLIGPAQTMWTTCLVETVVLSVA